MESTGIMQEIYPAKQVNQVRTEESERHTPYLAVDAEDIEEMFVKDYIRDFELTNETPIAWNSRTGKACAYTRKFGEGHATLLGFKIQYYPSFHDSHRRFVQHVFDLDGVKRSTNSTGKELLVVERRGNGYSYLFILNPIGLPAKSRVTYKDPADGKRRLIPRYLNGVEMKDRGGLIMAVNFPIARARATVAYTTSMIQDVSEKANSFALTLYGQRDTCGETSIRLPRKPKSVALAKATKLEEKWITAEKRLYVTYRHSDELAKLRVTL